MSSSERNVPVDSILSRLSPVSSAPASTTRFCSAKARAMSAEVSPLRVRRAGGTVTSTVGCCDPPDLHARDILHRQQFVLEALGLVVQLAPGVALARQSVEDPEHVAEVVVHHRRARPVGQAALDVGNLPPQLVPQLLHLVGTHLLLDVDRDLRHADAVLALQVIEFVERLYRLLQQVRDLVAHLFGRCAGIGRHDQRLLDGEGGILEFAHVRVGEQAAEEHQHEQQQPGHRLVLQKVFYQCIHGRDRVLRRRSR